MNETAEDQFTQFWKLYPRRIGKRAAQLKFRKACERATIFDIMKGLKEAVVRFKATDPKFIPYPATWLHQDRWLDELETVKATIEDPHDELEVYCRGINQKYKKSQQTKGNWKPIDDITDGKHVIDNWLKKSQLDGWNKWLMINKILQDMHSGTVVTSFTHWENRLK